MQQGERKTPLTVLEVQARWSSKNAPCRGTEQCYGCVDVPTLLREITRLEKEIEAAFVRGVTKTVKAALDTQREELLRDAISWMLAAQRAHPTLMLPTWVNGEPGAGYSVNQALSIARQLFPEPER